MSIVIFIIILFILIVAHEFGHFIVAKLFKIRVDEFGVGFPPKIFGFRPKNSETEYTFNWIPFGGFVKIFGENPDEEAISGPDSHRSFVNKPKYIQGAVIVAGVLFNILLAWILISVGFMTGLPTPVGSAPIGAVIENTELTITAVSPDSPAEIAGIKPGDRINALVTEKESLQENITTEEMSRFISQNGGEKIAVFYRRGSENGTIFITPKEGILEGRPAIGVTMDVIGILKLPIHKAFWEGGKVTIALTTAIAVGFWDLIVNSISGNGPGFSAVTGPVGIIGLVGDAADFGFVYLLGFTAFISINLAIINMIPFPALDGGRLLFLVIEAIKRSPIKPVVVNTANSIGFIILILLMLVVTFNDVIKLF